jgi:hypothetical protein
MDPGKLSFCFDFKWKGNVCYDSLAQFQEAPLIRS